MRSVASPRVATCVVAAAFASASAVIVPSNAQADDGVNALDPIATVTEATGIDVAIPTEGDAMAAADAAVAGALDPSGPETEATDAEPVASSPETAAPTTPASKASDVATPVVEPIAKPDTTTSTVDTTPDTVSSQPPATSLPVAVQAGPTNVNVSVRIDSAGDNGPVTQTNVAAVASTAATAAAPKPAATASTSSLAGSGADPVPQTGATAPATAPQDDPDTWSWQWDCVSVPAISMISPNSSTNSSAPKNWTWIWNCGDNPTQYQGATVGQYQPSNVNVSIRIASPGNNGPVSQANVAVAVSAGGSMPHGASTQAPGGSPTTVPIPVPLPVVTLPAIPGVSAVPGLTAVLSPVVPSLPQAPLESGVATLVEQGAAPLLGELGLTLVAPPAREPRVVSMLTSGAPSLPAFRPRWSSSPQESIAAAAAWSRSTTTTRAAAERGEPAAKAPNGREKPAPRWRTPAPATPAPAQAPPGASAAAAVGGGSSGGGGLPFFLALPFVAAMLDLARRAALDRVATPSGHRSRMPDDPG